MKSYLHVTIATVLASSLFFNCYAANHQSLNNEAKPKSMSSAVNSDASSSTVSLNNEGISREKFVGHWQGQLSVSENQSIEFVFNIEKSENDLVATLDVPAQNQFGLQFDSVSQIGNGITLVLNAAGIRYEGTLEKNTIKGVYQQGSFNAPVDLVKTQVKVTRQAKPQDPSLTPQYTVEEVNFLNDSDGHTLAGTLFVPDQPFTHTAIILSGSGPTQQDGDIVGHKLYAVLADLLTKKGIAVLRFDDRGVGESGGEYATATSKDFANDANAALRFLKHHDSVASSKVGYIGHSEGSLIAAIALANNKNASADFYISLAGPSTTGGEILIDQSYLIQKMRGMASSELEKDDKLQRKLISAISQDDSKEDIRALMSASGVPASQQEAQLSQLTSEWMQYFIKTDPKDYLRKLSLPVFAVHGAKDLQVPVRQNLDGFIQSIDKQWLTYKIYPNLNHLLQPADKGLPEEYAGISTTLSPEVVEDISLWLAQQ
ncbi:alpha/beta fold hydrolase [Alteromonas sp. MMG017]|uniref:alpha/beta hydrolase family protein n=1 Tax=Alteromonas sp. MMG017 TaxID=2822692 RepID=UPI001B39EF3E|nr:alpha/beta fold hydrolase [Alteromonas sp. MMG017]MBQ4829469.1 alpha/beta fold hydrolase [Alteromonas sp. MMG017]